MIDANEIYKNLWMGSCPDADELEYKDFDVIIYCAKGIQPKDKFKDKTVMYIPLEDVENLKQLSFDRAEQLAIWAAKDIAAGKKILVTCAAGMNRSGLIVGFILRLITGWAGIKCVEEIKKKRYPSLLNESFANYLSRLLSTTPLENK